MTEFNERFDEIGDASTQSESILEASSGNPCIKASGEVALIVGPNKDVEVKSRFRASSIYVGDGSSEKPVITKDGTWQGKIKAIEELPSLRSHGVTVNGIKIYGRVFVSITGRNLGMKDFEIELSNTWPTPTAFQTDADNANNPGEGHLVAACFTTSKFCVRLGTTRNRDIDIRAGIPSVNNILARGEKLYFYSWKRSEAFLSTAEFSYQCDPNWTGV